jgi:hypothetical protein
MATHQHHFAQQHLSRERRQNVRVAPELLTYVSFGGSNGGMVLDVSEDGMALATAFAIPDASLLNISIPADPTHELIEVTGRVVWIAESKRRLGVRLVGAPPRTQELLRSWISAERALMGEERANFDDGMLDEETAVAEFPGGVTAAPPLATPLAAAQSPATEPLAKRSVETQSNATRPSATQTALRSAKTAEMPFGKLVRDVPASQGEFSDFSPPVVTLPPTYAAAPSKVHDDRPQATLRAQSRFPSWITKSGRVPLAIAFTLVVIGGFALGAVIGRGVVAHWSHRASGTTVGALRPTDAAHPVNALQRSTPAMAVANLDAQGSAVGDSNTRPAAPPLVTSSRAGNFSGDNSSGNNSPANLADTALPGGEILVTPNVGDAPLRVDLGEEVIAHSPSLEIRSRRFVFVPAVANSGSHRPRKERLEVGILISRVTPQLSAAPPSVEVTQNAEEVVAVRATIAGDGHIVNVDPLNAPNMLTPSVMVAIREWRYDPSSLNGKPVETQADLTLKFRPLR